MRAVLDANVIISAMLSRSGPPAALLQSAEHGRYEAITTGKLLAEVVRSLRSAKLAHRVSAERLEDLIHFLVHSARLVPDAAPSDDQITSNPDDEYLIAIAQKSKAALVTGDRHLLDLPGMPAIMSPRQFLALLADGATAG